MGPSLTSSRSLPLPSSPRPQGPAYPCLDQDARTKKMYSGLRAKLLKQVRAADRLLCVALAEFGAPWMMRHQSLGADSWGPGRMLSDPAACSQP